MKSMNSNETIWWIWWVNIFGIDSNLHDDDTEMVNHRTNDLLLNLDSVRLKLSVLTDVCWVCCSSLCSWDSSFSSSCFAWKYVSVGGFYHHEMRSKCSFKIRTKVSWKYEHWKLEPHLHAALDTFSFNLYQIRQEKGNIARKKDSV